ncbi:MAG: zf-HC2 domain-containing protein [Candidatus Krumholzibacteriia bacterium]|nr:zf-HC2 domain-containing protein [bacterium]MCB9515017.1 zf-HC2 domain-containing protein [Candidatus Latescibacterota bacterium]
MNCKRAQAAISLFLDERLDPAGQTQLNRHLAGCTECTAYLNELKEGLAALHELPLESPSPNFDWNLKRKLQQAQHEGWQYRDEDVERRFWPRFVLSAAAALAIALGGGALVYRAMQAPSMFPPALGGSASQGGLAQDSGEGLQIPSTPQPFAGGLQESSRGFQPVGGSDVMPLQGPEHWTIQAADPRQAILLEGKAAETGAPSASADSLGAPATTP